MIRAVRRRALRRQPRRRQQRHDPRRATLALVDQLGTGAGSNPQDVAVVGDKLYVPALGTAGVVVMTRGSTRPTTTIDLTRARDPDGKPDCVSAFAVGNDVYVACGLLDASFRAARPRQGRRDRHDHDQVRHGRSASRPGTRSASSSTTPASSVFGGDLADPGRPVVRHVRAGCVTHVHPGAAPTATCAATPSRTWRRRLRHRHLVGNKLWLSVVVSQNF